MALGCGHAPTPAATTRPAREGFVPVEGGRIWYRIVGNRPGTPVVYVHGGPGSTGCRGTALAALGDRPVIIYDQLGGGRSDRPADTTLWRLDRFVAEIDSLRAHLGLREIHLYGASWGATVAAEYALTHPTHESGLRSLTLAGPLLSTRMWLEDAAVLRAQLPPAVDSALRAHEAAGTTEHPDYVAATDSFYARFYMRRPERQIPDCVGSLSLPVYRYMWGPTEFHATGTLRDYDRFDRLPELRLPVLLVAGEYDESRPETVRRFQARIPGARFVEIEGSGHAILSDAPERLVEAYGAFLREVEGRR